MRISKVRPMADENGFVPMGAYFEFLARDLAVANAREAAQRDALDEEDRRLERRYRRRNAKAEAGLNL